MQLIKLSEATAARRRITFTMVLAGNLQTRSTGLTGIAVRISKNGAATTAGGGTVTEVDSTNMPGVYYYECATGDVDTLGQLILDITKTSEEPREIVVMIVAFDPFDAVRMGQSALPNANAEAAGGLYTRGTGVGQVNQAANGQIDTNTVTWQGTSVSTSGNGTKHPLLP